MNNQIVKFGLILSIVCVIAAGLLATVNLATREKIKQQRFAEQQAALKEVMPQAESFTPVKDGEDVLYYQAKDFGKNVIGYCFLAQGKGYSSIIEAMAGMDIKGVISGVKIISHNETPGLGSKIAAIDDETTLFDAMTGRAKDKPKPKPWFGQRFSGKNVSGLEKEVDAISGATISSSAVIKAVKEKAEATLKLINENHYAAH